MSASVFWLTDNESWQTGACTHQYIVCEFVLDFQFCIFPTVCRFPYSSFMGSCKENYLKFIELMSAK